MNRSEELRLNWNSVQESLKLACSSAQRNFDDITVIAVTKTWPASDVDELAQLGITDVGENRDQEAKEKKLHVQTQRLHWHAIGQIQTNKVKSIVQWADVVHSIDRLELVAAFEKHLKNAGMRKDVFVQVNLDKEKATGRGGVALQDSLRIVDEVLNSSSLRLLGVMGVAPLDGNLDAAFAQLQEVSMQVRAMDSQATKISAGMSGDYEIALKYGATHLRLGSLILGHRSYNG